MANAMRALIEAKSAGSVLGSTLAGREWCIKALHPAENAVTVDGVPTYSASPSTVMHFQTNFSITCPDTVTWKNWGFDAQLTPHPITFFAGLKSGEDNVVAMRAFSEGRKGKEAAPLNGIDAAPESMLFEVMNSQLVGASHQAKFASLCANCERWRVAYMSLTLDYNGPALANQGTLAVCQRPYTPRVSYSSWMETGTSTECRVGPRVLFLHGDAGGPSPDFPDYDRCNAFANSYLGEAKEGVYVPLKLDNGFDQWISSGDALAWSWRPVAGNSFPVLKQNNNIPLDTEGPFPSLACAYFHANGAGASMSTCLTSPMLAPTVADICVRNLSPQAAFRGLIRFGLEVQCAPSSTYAPQLHPPVPLDEQALAAYFKIARELKDAYPSSYNSFDKLWSVIKGAARVVFPVASRFIAPALDALFAPKGAKSEKSAAAVERDQQKAKEVLTPKAVQSAVAAGEPVRRKKSMKMKKKSGVSTV